VTKDEHKRLKSAELVEGRFPKLVVAAEIAAVTGEKARHIRDRGLDNQFYQEMIVELIRKHQPVTREDIDGTILGKLPEVLNPDQKLKKIHNLLYELSHRQKRIRNAGSRKYPQWVLLTGQANEAIKPKISKRPNE
jgi:ATP-dependent DNA helicase RecG